MQTYDYIIVGSGSSGGFVLWVLAQNPNLRILLLEAGVTDQHWTTTIPAASRYTFDGGSRNWCFETNPEPHMNNRKLFQPRGKVIGGSSSLNGMVYVRGHRADYDRWVAMGALGWDYDSNLAHFQAIESYSQGQDNYRGSCGPIIVEKLKDNHPIEQAFLDAGKQAGYPAPDDYNGFEQLGVSAFDANIDSGWRSGTARACVRPVMHQRNVTVLTKAHVSKIVIENGKAVGVNYRHGGQDHQARASREIVLSAGAFQTPQLLMVSGIGPADHLREFGIEVIADLAGVGQNLQDHLECHIKFDCPHKGMTKNHLMARHRIILAGIQWYLAKNGPAATSHSRMGGFFKSTSDATHPNIQFHFWPYFMDGWSPQPEKDGYCFDVGPTQSPSRGWVKLGTDDPFAAPRILLNGLSCQQDFADFRAAIRIARDIGQQSAFDFCRGSEISPGAHVQDDARLDEYVRNNANSAYHPCGTARMGTDALAVCDAHARVYGVDGLRVADASLMPTITNGNINAPCMMIGHRVGTMLRDADQ